jgi:hypothetical protein
MDWTRKVNPVTGARSEIRRAAIRHGQRAVLHPFTIQKLRTRPANALADRV